MANKGALPIGDVGADVDDEELVFFFVEDVFGLVAEGGDFALRESAEEDAVLHVFAVVAEEFEELGAALVSGGVCGDVVGAEIDVAVVG